jgi:hypothetical protein
MRFKKRKSKRQDVQEKNAAQKKSKEVKKGKENKTKQNKRAAPKKKERKTLSPHAELYCCLLELGLERVYTRDIDQLRTTF